MIRKLTTLITIIFLFVTFPIHTILGQGEISVKSKVDRSKITIGDRIRYSVVVTRSPDVNVQMPGLAENLGMFELTDYEVYEAIQLEDKLIDSTDYIISTFETGEFEIPPLTISYNTEGDTTLKYIATQSITIYVESLNPDQRSAMDSSKRVRYLIISRAEKKIIAAQITLPIEISHFICGLAFSSVFIMGSDLSVICSCSWPLSVRAVDSPAD